MRNAPSVTCPVGRSLFSALLRAVLWSAGAGAVLWWIASQQVDPVRVAVSAFSLVACAAWSVASWRGEPVGLLGWDGTRWTFLLDGLEEFGAVRPALDLQFVLLVHWRGERSAWLWLERRADPARWDAVRRAVHSPASDMQVPGAEPPAAAS